MATPRTLGESGRRLLPDAVPASRTTHRVLAGTIDLHVPIARLSWVHLLDLPRPPHAVRTDPKRDKLT
jgi:hypothetical protein